MLSPGLRNEEHPGCDVLARPQHEACISKLTVAELVYALTFKGVQIPKSAKNVVLKQLLSSSLSLPHDVPVPPMHASMTSSASYEVEVPFIVATSHQLVICAT